MAQTVQGLFNSEPLNYKYDPNYVSQQANNSTISTGGVLENLLGGIVRNPGLDALGRTVNNLTNYVTGSGNTAGSNNPSNILPPISPIITNQTVQNNQVAQNNQVKPNNVTLDNLTNKPASMGNVINGMVQNPQVTQMQAPTAQKYQYTGPINTPFGSPVSNNQVAQPQNTPSVMGNFNFNQDTYNQGLRNTATEGFNNSRQNFLDVASNIKNASIPDMLSMAIQGNQYRQDMRKSQADFTSANSLASQNLQQQNQLGLQDLINQRSVTLDSQKTNNDSERLNLEQQRFKELQNQNNADNQYRSDYLNNYSLSQLAQQQSNQNANLDLQRQLNSGNILKNDLLTNTASSIQKLDSLKSQATTDFLNSEVGKNTIAKNLPPESLNSIISSFVNQKLSGNPEVQQLQSQLQSSMTLSQLFNGGGSKNLGYQEIENTNPETGEKITTKTPITSSNSIAKSTTK